MASARDAKSTMGPSAPPIRDIAAASPYVKPIAWAIGKVATVPSSANIAISIPVKGNFKTLPTSDITPIPIKTKQAIKPLLNIKV